MIFFDLFNMAIRQFLLLFMNNRLLFDFGHLFLCLFIILKHILRHIFQLPRLFIFLDVNLGLATVAIVVIIKPSQVVF